MESRERLKEVLNTMFEPFLDNVFSARPRQPWDPIGDWELNLLSTGLAKEYVVPERDQFIIEASGPGEEPKRYCPFGFNREYLTQIAAYVALVEELGYPRSRCRVEEKSWDAAVLREDGSSLLIAVEAKASRTALEKLIALLLELPMPVADDSPHDHVRKAQYIVTTRPAYVWFVAPGLRQAYAVSTTDDRRYELEHIGESPPSFQ